MHSDKTSVLRQMFAGMGETDLTELADVAEIRSYPPDVILCREGKEENTFYAIVSGRVEVTKKLDAETQEVINRPGPGNFVGEIALVQEGPRTATVRTMEPTTVLEIDRDDFIRMLNQSAPLAVRIMLQITPRLRDIDMSTIAHLRQEYAELEQAYKKLEKEYIKLQKKS